MEVAAVESFRRTIQTRRRTRAAVVVAQAAILVSAAVWDTRTVLRLLWWGARVGG